MGDPVEDGYHNVQIRTTSCLEGFSAVTINLEMIFQRMYVQTGKPSQTV